MRLRSSNWSVLAAAFGGILWMSIPLAYAAYPWGAAGNRAYGHLDLLLFAGPILITLALPKLFRCYGSRLPRAPRMARFVTMTGGVLLIVSSFGYGWGDLVLGVGVASPLLLVALLVMSTGLLILGGNIVRTRPWYGWEGALPIAVASVPFVWLASVLFGRVFLRSEEAVSRFFEANFTALVVLLGVAWFLQAFALLSVLRRGDALRLVSSLGRMAALSARWVRSEGGIAANLSAPSRCWKRAFERDYTETRPSSTHSRTIRTSSAKTPRYQALLEESGITW